MKKLVLGSLIAVLAVPVMSVSAVANTGSAVRSEPAPDEDTRGGNEETDPRQENHEGNDRGGGDASGGFTEGGGGAQDAVLFSSVGSTVNQTTEDRGDVLVIRRQVATPVGGGAEICVVSTVKVIEKASGKVIKSDSSEMCYSND